MSYGCKLYTAARRWPHLALLETLLPPGERPYLRLQEGAACSADQAAGHLLVVHVGDDQVTMPIASDTGGRSDPTGLAYLADCPPTVRDLS